MDPLVSTGLALSDRGAGCLFGEDVTDQFLHHNKLKLIVRSHECIDDGCEATHHNKVYTLFSASNYCGDAGNYGAIMTFEYRKHSPTEIHQYMAPVLDVEKGLSMAEVEEEKEKQEATTKFKSNSIVCGWTEWIIGGENTRWWNSTPPC